MLFPEGMMEPGWYWTLTGPSPAERLRRRVKERLQLGRYARQSMDAWWEMDVVEFDLHLEVLAEILKSENGGGAVENIE